MHRVTRAGRAKEGLFPTAPREGGWLFPYLDFRLLSPKLWENNFLFMVIFMVATGKEYKRLKHKCENQLFQNQWTDRLLFLSLGFPAWDTALIHPWQNYFWNRKREGKQMQSRDEEECLQPEWRRDFEIQAKSYLGISSFSNSSLGKKYFLF